MGSDIVAHVRELYEENQNVEWNKQIDGGDGVGGRRKFFSAASV